MMLFLHVRLFCCVMKRGAAGERTDQQQRRKKWIVGWRFLPPGTAPASSRVLWRRRVGGLDRTSRSLMLSFCGMGRFGSPRWVLQHSSQYFFFLYRPKTLRFIHSKSQWNTLFSLKMIDIKPKHGCVAQSYAPQVSSGRSYLRENSDWKTYVQNLSVFVSWVPSWSWKTLPTCWSTVQIPNTKKMARVKLQ